MQGYVSGEMLLGGGTPITLQVPLKKQSGYLMFGSKLMYMEVVSGHRSRVSPG